MQTPDSETSRPPLWASEPFRVFFPLGLIASAVAALLWPAFFAGLISTYPNVVHPRLMIFGFGLAFVTGFLGTSWPRFVDARPLSRAEMVVLSLTWLAIQGCYLLGHIPAGDIAASLHLFFLTVALLKRLGRRRDLPPAGFALTLGTVAATGLVALQWGAAPGIDSPFLIYFTRLVAFQGFLLVPIIGVGTFLYPRFFAGPGIPAPTVLRPGPGRWAIPVSIFVILISFAVEAAGLVRAGNLVRLAGYGGWAALSLPAEVWIGKAPSTRAWGLRIALFSVGLSFLLRALAPVWLFAFEHILFLGGFGLGMLITADRVATGHGGDPRILFGKSRAWRWIVWTLLLAAATRASADLIPSTRISHYIYTAILWVFVVALWGFLDWRHLTRVNED